MVAFIQDIIHRFGGRYFGSEAEKNAQIHTRKVLDAYCDATEIVAFDSALEAHFQALKLFVILFYVCLGLFWISIPAAAILAMLNGLLFLAHFVTYRHWLDFLFPKKTSWNVIGDIEPIQTATSTLIIAGHIDSVKEFKWWYKLKQLGVTFTVLSGFLFPLLAIFLVLAWVLDAPAMQYIWWAFLALSPMFIVLFDMHGKEVVHGALDNLTGVAMAVEMAKVFSENRLQHTRIRCISFGAEEAGLRGAFAYGKTNMAKLRAENALLINLDTIKDLDHLTLATGETNTLVRFDKRLVARMHRSFKAVEVPVKVLPLHVGASDASAFGILGLPALSLIGMMSERLDPCYHTRLDNLDHLDGKAMEALKKVLVHFVKEWDEGHQQG